MLNYTGIALDYQITIEDDDVIYEIKRKMQDVLTEPERRILYAYLELGTYSAVAKLFKVSSPTIKKYIIKVIEKLK